MRSYLLLLTLACTILASWSCDVTQYQSGCKISGGTCVCSYGCSHEYIYRTRRDCTNALRGPRVRESNICSSLPCLRGHCLQTSNEPGFTCKCEGTGFYGRRCEKACVTSPVYGAVFPHECVVI